MYIKQSVNRPTGNPGLGIKVRDKIEFIDVADVAFMPARNDKGVAIEDDIILNPGAYAVGLYLTPGSAEVTSAAEGDPDQIGFTPSVKFNHPGNSLEVREFKANMINRPVIVLIRHCDGQPTDIIGDLCNPCMITPSYTGNKDASTNEFTATQVAKGKDIGVYQGTIPTEEPVAVVDAAATSVEFAAEGQYQLSAGAGAITEIKGGSHGAVVTLLGASGASSPSVTASATLLLKGGKTFVGTEGSQITFRAFEGAEDAIYWIEQSRYVVA